MIHQGGNTILFIKKTKRKLALPAAVTGWVMILFLFSGFVQSASDDESITDPSSEMSAAHIVKDGENLWSIAASYTTAYDWIKIYEANRQHISISDKIYPGQVLVIPVAMLGLGVQVDNLTKILPPPVPAKDLAAAEDEPAKEQASFDPVLQIDGLIIDETISKVGRDFYTIFYSEWDSPADAFNYTVTVSETPMPNYSTRVTIKVNDTDVFQANLQPRYDVIEGAAQQGVGRTQWYLTNYETAPLSY